MRLDSFSRLRQRNRVAAVQKQLHVFRGKLLSYRAPNAAARTSDEITLHISLRKTSNVQRRTSNAEFGIGRARPPGAPLRVGKRTARRSVPTTVTFGVA